MFRSSRKEGRSPSGGEAASEGTTIKSLFADGDEPAARKLFNQQFMAALKKLRANDLGPALEAFLALEAQLPTEAPDHIIVVKNRVATVLAKQQRWSDALSVYDDLMAHSTEMTEFDRERFPDEIATTFWARCLCLEQLGRIQEANQAIADLVEEVGSGSTDTQREYLAEAHLLSARAARAEARLQDALSEVDAAIATCGRFEQPMVSTTPGNARRMRQELLAEIAEVS